MSFWNAVDSMLSKKKVRRKSWPKWQFMFFDKSKNDFIQNSRWSEGVANTRKLIKANDIFAHDWEVFGDE